MMLTALTSKVHRIAQHAIARTRFVGAPTVKPFTGNIAVPQQQLICSAASEELGGGWNREKIPLSDIVPGQTYEGTVKGLASYGCFVDIGTTTDGLCHISQLSDSFVENVEDVVSPGQTVQVRVIAIEGDRRMSLSMKADDGGRNNRRGRRDDDGPPRHSLNMGDKVSGEVARVVSFGAFITLEDGFDVLLPASEMNTNGMYNAQPRDLVQEGDFVEGTVIKVDGNKVAITNIPDEEY